MAKRSYLNKQSDKFLYRESTDKLKKYQKVKPWTWGRYAKEIVGVASGAAMGFLQLNVPGAVAGGNIMHRIMKYQDGDEYLPKGPASMSDGQLAGLEIFTPPTSVGKGRHGVHSKKVTWPAVEGKTSGFLFSQKK